jgi:catechol 2,3-dioxygenase-like lactoylglutathione lyase family enzyme
MAADAPAPWPKGIRAITLFVEDIDATKRFYSSVFGLPILFQDEVSVVYQFGGTLVNLLLAREGVELIEPAPIAPPEAGVRGQLTIEVDDVDAMCAQLRQRGVELINGPINRPWGVRTACFADPSGHNWELAQPIPGA